MRRIRLLDLMNRDELPRASRAAQLLVPGGLDLDVIPQ